MKRGVKIIKSEIKTKLFNLKRFFFDFEFMKYTEEIKIVIIQAAGIQTNLLNWLNVDKDSFKLSVIFHGKELIVPVGCGRKISFPGEGNRG